MINYLYIFIFLTIAIPSSFSRIITTVDPPSSYTVDGISKETGITLFSQDYDNKIGINIAYQQIIFYRGKFNLYTGAEFMLGKKAESRIAFHSTYIMPSSRDFSFDNHRKFYLSTPDFTFDFKL